MNEDYITFDFANGKIKVHNSGETGTLEMPYLDKKRAAIYAAAGLELINNPDLAKPDVENQDVENQDVGFTDVGNGNITSLEL